MARQRESSDIPVFNILQSPLDSDEVIVGTELGVWWDNFSFGASWSQANAGMKDLRVTDGLRKGDNKVFISLDGNFPGVFKIVNLRLQLALQQNQLKF